MNNQSPLRALPSISSLLDSVPGKRLVNVFGAPLIKHLLRAELDELRDDIASGSEAAEIDLPSRIFASLQEKLSIFSESGRAVINATGVILHTGLGRAPLSAEAIDSLQQLGGYSLLEVDERSGDRGAREREVEQLLQALVGCEAATVVNNNAAATFMALRALAANREVVISRGQLIEIGGSYRLPEVMKLSGCKLREVGTTNITRAEDYEQVITSKTGAILHVHTSNYRIQGFHAVPELRELREIADRHNLPLIEDLGSGALVSLEQFGLKDEQLVSKSLADGADVVCFSGDKLVGGPQAGIICGKKELVAKIRKNQFFRMFRPEKLTLLALEKTLLAFSRGDYRETLPIYQLLSRSQQELRRMAEEVVRGLSEATTDLNMDIVETDAYLGGGTLPEDRLPSVAIRISTKATKLSAALRIGSPRVFGRIEKNSFLLDLRAVADDEVHSLISALKSAI